MKEIDQSIQLLEQAADIRVAIKDMYDKYRSLTIYMQTLQESVKHKDIKAAVDAIHYFGGVGYPHPNSPGRMEELLDKFVGMYRVLEFIGRGKMVHEHLARYGMKVTMDPDCKLQNAPLDRQDIQQLMVVCRQLGIGTPKVSNTSDVFAFAINMLNDFQSTICNSSNKIRKEIKPEVLKISGMEGEEYKRSFTSVKMAKAERMGRVPKLRKASTSSYKTFLNISKSVEGKTIDE